VRHLLNDHQLLNRMERSEMPIDLEYLRSGGVIRMPPNTHLPDEPILPQSIVEVTSVASKIRSGAGLVRSRGFQGLPCLLNLRPMCQVKTKFIDPSIVGGVGPRYIEHMIVHANPLNLYLEGDVTMKMRNGSETMEGQKCTKGPSDEDWACQFIEGSATMFDNVSLADFKEDVTGDAHSVMRNVQTNFANLKPGRSSSSASHWRAAGWDAIQVIWDSIWANNQTVRLKGTMEWTFTYEFPEGVMNEKTFVNNYSAGFAVPVYSAELVW